MSRLAASNSCFGRRASVANFSHYRRPISSSRYLPPIFGCRGPLRASLRSPDSAGSRRVSRRRSRSRTPSSVAQTTGGEAPRAWAECPHACRRRSPATSDFGARRIARASRAPVAVQPSRARDRGRRDGFARVTRTLRRRSPSTPGRRRRMCRFRARHAHSAAGAGSQPGSQGPIEHLGFAILALPHRTHSRQRWTSVTSPRR